MVDGKSWHEGHTTLFEKALEKTGQVLIMVRDVQGVDAGMGNDDNLLTLKKLIMILPPNCLKEDTL